VKGRPSGDWRSGLAEAQFIEGADFQGLGNGLVRVPVTQSEGCGFPTNGEAEMWKPIGCLACHSEREIPVSGLSGRRLVNMTVSQRPRGGFLEIEEAHWSKALSHSRVSGARVKAAA